MDTATANTIFFVATPIVAVGLTVWIVIFLRRASRITGARASLLTSDIASLSPPVEGTTPQVPASATGSSISWDTLPWSAPQAPARSVAEPPSNSIESKLAELGDLHARKLISDEELAVARAKALSE
jgi:hypothetical protein